MASKEPTRGWVGVYDDERRIEPARHALRAGVTRRASPGKDAITSSEKQQSRGARLTWPNDMGFVSFVRVTKSEVLPGMGEVIARSIIHGCS